MELSLQQARNLEKTIESRTFSDKVIKEVRSYNEDVLNDDLEKVCEDFMEDSINHIDLIDVRFKIKNKINEANMACGVSKLLNDRDTAYAEKSFVDSLDKYVVNGDDQFRQALSHPSDLYHISACTKDNFEVLDEIRKDALDDIQKIQHELHVLNSEVTISIDESDVEVLKKFGLV